MALPKAACFSGGGDLLYFLHVVPERQFDVIGGDAAETIINEDEDAERRAVCAPFGALYLCRPRITSSA